MANSLKAVLHCQDLPTPFIEVIITNVFSALDLIGPLKTKLDAYWKINLERKNGTEVNLGLVIFKCG